MASNRQKGNGGRWKGRQKLEKSDTEIIYQEKNITLCFARGCIIISKPVLSAEMRTEASGGTDTEGCSRGGEGEGVVGKRRWKRNGERTVGFVLYTIIEREHSAACDSSSLPLIISSSLPGYILPILPSNPLSLSPSPSLQLEESETHALLGEQRRSSEEVIYARRRY